MTIETTINGGLPVFASGDVYSAEPDVGIMTQYVDGVYVRFLSGHEFPGKLSDLDEQRLINEIVDAYNEGPCDY